MGMKKYMILMLFFMLADEPLRAESNFTEGVIVGIIIWAYIRDYFAPEYLSRQDTTLNESKPKEEIDLLTTLPCGHQYICPACQICRENCKKQQSEAKNNFYRPPLKKR